MQDTLATYITTFQVPEGSHQGPEFSHNYLITTKKEIVTEDIISTIFTSHNWGEKIAVLMYVCMYVCM